MMMMMMILNGAETLARWLWTGGTKWRRLGQDEAPGDGERAAATWIGAFTGEECADEIDKRKWLSESMLISSTCSRTWQRPSGGTLYPRPRISTASRIVRIRHRPSWDAPKRNCGWPGWVDYTSSEWVEYFYNESEVDVELFSLFNVSRLINVHWLETIFVLFCCLRNGRITKTTFANTNCSFVLCCFLGCRWTLFKTKDTWRIERRDCVPY